MVALHNVLRLQVYLVDHHKAHLHLQDAVVHLLQDAVAHLLKGICLEQLVKVNQQ